MNLLGKSDAEYEIAFKLFAVSSPSPYPMVMADFADGMARSRIPRPAKSTSTASRRATRETEPAISSPSTGTAIGPRCTWAARSIGTP